MKTTTVRVLLLALESAVTFTASAQSTDTGAHSDAAARAKPAHTDAGKPSVTELRKPSSSEVSDTVERAPKAGAALRLRLALPGDYGVWAFTRATIGEAPRVASIVGGEVGISSRLAFVLAGAQAPFDPRVSGMLSGLRIHLMSLESPFQMSLAAGMMRDLSGDSSWAQLDASRDFGRWRVAGTLRNIWPSSDRSTQRLVNGSVGTSVDLAWARLGIDYAVEHGLVSRSALLPWLSMPIYRRMAFRASAALPVSGDRGFTALLSMTVGF